MHAAAISPRGGVSPRDTRLRGQSIIEYVLIIAIIGLVIVFAGPGVAGVIRNQFNLVGNTVNNGTSAGTEGGGASGGGSTGTASATVQAAIAKDAKNWTLDEQEAVAKDIAAKGEASPAYAKAKAAMDAGTEFSTPTRSGSSLLKYRIIGINHDDLADGSGKAGLTFLVTSDNINVNGDTMNTTDTNVGGWEKSEMRQKLNSGRIWARLSTDFQSKVKAVTKLTNNVGGDDKNAAVTATTDKLFLLSYSEMVDAPYSYWAQNYPWISSEGTQYEAFKGKISVFSKSGNASSPNGEQCWQRSTHPGDSTGFLYSDYSNQPTWPNYYFATSFSQDIFPAFCF